jgi:fructokinase
MAEVRPSDIEDTHLHMAVHRTLRYNDAMQGGGTIVGLGESLWDLLPSGPKLGGAPLNVVVHVNQLLQEHTGRGMVATRAGVDGLGRQLLAELAERNLDADYVQRDPTHPTGTVDVRLTAGGAQYDFAEDVAWDHLELTPEWENLARDCSAVCFGTLAQRSAISRGTIQRFLELAKLAVRLFDVNLRPPFYDPHVLEQSCRSASIVKLNEQELPVLAESIRLPSGTPVFRLAQLRIRYDLDAVVYTRGRRGTMIVLGDEVISSPAVAYPATNHADDVGAGDACSAAVLVGWLMRLPPTRIAELANHIGAFVASQCGATPKLPNEILELMHSQ